MFRTTRAMQAENRRALRSRMEQRIRRRRLVRRIVALAILIIVLAGIALMILSLTHRSVSGLRI